MQKRTNFSRWGYSHQVHCNNSFFALGNTTLFTVDGSGLVTTQSTFDFESVKSYLLVITVADGGSPQFTTYVTVTVQVTGTNEYAPVFSNSTRTVSHSEVRYLLFLPALLDTNLPRGEGWKGDSYDPFEVPPHPYPIPQTMKDRNLGVFNARDSYVPSSGSLMTRVAWNLLKEEPLFWHPHPKT